MNRISAYSFFCAVISPENGSHYLRLSACLFMDTHTNQAVAREYVLYLRSIYLQKTRYFSHKSNRKIRYILISIYLQLKPYFPW
jgi:hypothetical protein